MALIRQWNLDQLQRVCSGRVLGPAKAVLFAASPNRDSEGSRGQVFCSFNCLAVVFRGAVDWFEQLCSGKADSVTIAETRECSASAKKSSMRKRPHSYLRSSNQQANQS